MQSVSYDMISVGKLLINLQEGGWDLSTMGMRDNENR